MNKFVLDTSVLLQWWNRCRSQARRAPTLPQAEAWARGLIARRKTKAIVTPVYLDVVGGATNGQGVRLMRAYLAPFECIDHQRILPQD